MIDIKKELDEKITFRNYLYPRGYLISTNANINLNSYPFYNNWKSIKIGKYCIYTKNDQKSYIYESDNIIYFLIGHSYNPFSMQYDENELLKEISSCNDEHSFYERINEFTGNFLFGIIENDSLNFVSDAACMLTAYYGCDDNDLYISQYSHLIGDICNLKQDEYVQELLEYKFYSLFGKMLPGDLSPYKEFKHTIPNFIYKFDFNKKNFKHKRFYPIISLNQSDSLDNYNEIIKNSAAILHNSLELIAKKWDKPAISMTGGCDSKTTLSCANGLYDKFTYYSYISSEAERVDAIAAEKICENLHLNHHTDFISETDSDFENIELWRSLLEQNCGNIGKNNTNDVRKRIYYVNNQSFDVEVKSWVSEVARAYYSKRFDNYNFPDKPTPRYMSALYKVFAGNRKLLKKTDKLFADFLKKYYSDDIFSKINWTDLLFWEYRVSSWNGLVISNEQSLSYDITIPYNNRKLLELLLSTPLDYRISDKCHKDIQKLMNNKIHNMNISVTNLKHTNSRAKFEKMYLKFRTVL